MVHTNRRELLMVLAEKSFKEAENMIHSVQQKVSNGRKSDWTDQKREGHECETVLPITDGEFNHG